MDDSRSVIIGGGLAGAKTAEGLRDGGCTGPIVLVGAEEHLPYERPPLSKDYLTGTADRASIDVHDRQWYADHDVELRLGVPPPGWTVTRTNSCWPTAPASATTDWCSQLVHARHPRPWASISINCAPGGVSSLDRVWTGPSVVPISPVPCLPR